MKESLLLQRANRWEQETSLLEQLVYRGGFSLLNAGVGVELGGSLIAQNIAKIEIQLLQRESLARERDLSHKENGVLWVGDFKGLLGQFQDRISNTSLVALEINSSLTTKCGCVFETFHL